MKNKTKVVLQLESSKSKYFPLAVTIPEAFKKAKHAASVQVASWWKAFKRKPAIKALALCASIASSAAADGQGNHLQMELGPSLALLDGVLGYGAAVTLMGRTSSDLPLYLGLESGIAHWEEGQGLLDNLAKTTLNSIPVLAVAQYRFEISDSSVRPYIGVAPGISLSVHGSVDAQGDQAALKARTDVQFELLIKPGVAVGSFFFEPKFGILDGNFIFLPTAGIVLGI